MNAKAKAEELVNTYRVLLMNEDTECGNEILCTLIAKKCALIVANELRSETYMYFSDRKAYWEQVIIEIEKL
jgi:hypothetical protein